MVHGLANLLWSPYVNILKYGIAAYVVAKGLLGTLVDVLDGGIKLLQ